MINNTSSNEAHYNLFQLIVLHALLLSSFIPKCPDEATNGLCVAFYSFWTVSINIDVFLPFQHGKHIIGHSALVCVLTLTNKGLSVQYDTIQVWNAGRLLRSITGNGGLSYLLSLEKVGPSTCYN
jgi:hypothetical protein